MGGDTQTKLSESDKIQIQIPDTGGSVTFETFKKDTDSKIKDINYILVSVIVILLVMVGTLVIDSFHFNSATYKEYSEKIDTLDTTQKTNEALLSQIQSLSEQNKKNQELTIEQQKQIKELLKK